MALALPPSPVFTRRRFVQLGTCAALPLLLPSRLFGARSPNQRLRLGQIGCGRIARDHDLPGVLNTGLADVVAVCDLDAKRLSEAKVLLQNWYQKRSLPCPEISTYRNYRELLARSDIDAVVLSTPDHQHAEPALAAVLAGKDLYLQKPFTMTLAEGILLRDAILKKGTVFQVGSQQRSSEQFRLACEWVRGGRLGRLHAVEIGLPIDPTKADDPAQAIPPNLDYESWLGPTPLVYYTEQRVHPQNDYSRPGWLRNEAFCLGMITGWGSHHYDILHWALDQESGGPLSLEAKAEFPGNSIWNVHGAYEVHLRYPGEIQVRVSDKFPNGLRFRGEEGWLFVSRSGQTTSSDPKTSSGGLKALDASDPRLLDPRGKRFELERSEEHHLNWLEAVLSRKQPITPAPVAHRSNSACILSWIAMKLGRPLRWDAKAERFLDDPEANALLSRPERAPFGALRHFNSLS